MAHRFYIPQLQLNQNELPEDEAHHAIHVLRLKVGDTFEVFDGIGNFAEATMISLGKKACSCEVNQLQLVEKSNHQLHLAIAPPKNADRWDWILEKAVELNVHTIIPLLCERSERKQINEERMHKIVLSASKQSLRYFLPVVKPLIPFQTFIQTKFENALIAHCDLKFERVPISNKINHQNQTLVMIGPEGDFSSNEIQTAYQLGFSGINLGNLRLRTETAAIAVCAAFQLSH